MPFVPWKLPIFGASVANDKRNSLLNGLLACCQGRYCSWKMFHWKDIYILHDECSSACCSIMFHRQNALPTSVCFCSKAPHLTHGLRYIKHLITIIFRNLTPAGGFLKCWVFPNKQPWVFPFFFKNDQPLGCEMGVALFMETSIW